MTTYPDTASSSLKGSWEGQLETARRLAADFSDEALPIYEKLYTRLSKMPVAKRMAANERLQKLFLSAAVDYQAYLALYERYDEAVDVVDRLAEEASDDEYAMWQMHGVLVLIAADQTDAAIDRVKQITQEAEADDLEGLGDLFMTYMRLDRVEDAAATLDEMAARAEALDVSEEARQRDRAYLADLGTTLALERRDFDRAEALFAEAIELNPDLKANLNRLYSGFVRLGEPKRALPYVKRDQQHPIRAAFWHGLALQQLGEAEEAAKQWRKAVFTDLRQSDEMSFLEYVLAHYYLGDPESEGLSVVLSTLQEEGSTVWALFFLAGLGWALHGNPQNAHTNFQRAVRLRRLNSMGRTMPAESWRFCVDLLDDADLDEFAKYFEIPELSEVEGDASTGSAQGAEAEEIVNQGDTVSRGNLSEGAE